MPIDPASALTAAKQAEEGLSIINRIYVWSKRKIYPKAPVNSTGIVIAIITEDSKNREQVKNDFIRTIEILLASSKAKKPFHIIDLPTHHTERIKKIDDAKKVLHKCRSKFIIWGIARDRVLEGKRFFVLDLQAGVSHGLIFTKVSDALAKEMHELLPSRVKISGDNDLIEFEVNATTIELAARYLIGETSYLSGDVEYSLGLFEELHDRLAKYNSNELPSQLQKHIKLLKKKVVINLVYINLKLALNYQLKWRNTRDVKDIDIMIEYVMRVDSLIPDIYDSAVLWSFYHFVKNRNTALARKAIAPWKATGIADSSWAFNYAFLYAYEGKLREATRIYKIAFRRDSDSAFLLQLEEFLEWILSEHPEKYQLYYCLGLINYFGKKEYMIALNYFKKFLQANPEGQFKEQAKSVQGYITGIDNNKIIKAL